MNSKQMAELFDVIDIEDDNPETDSSDYNATEKDESSSFENRCGDIKAIMEEEETVTNVDNEIITSAVKQAESSPPPKHLEDVDEEIPGDASGSFYAEEVEKDMAEFEIEDEDGESLPEPETEPEPEPVEVEQAKPTVNKQPKESKKEVKKTKSELEDDNPLSLFGSDLVAYHDIKKNLPQFTLFDGSVSFREFYRYKVELLKSVTSRFAVLDLNSIKDEISEIRTDHFVGDRAISPDLIRVKLDESYKARSRLSTIMIQILEQFAAWERWVEMLRSKLWKDHATKGAHNRDGLTIEHMADVEDYVSVMKGILDAAKQQDGMLKAAAESLSRQLSCLQLKEATGFSQKMEEHTSLSAPSKKKTADLDSLDSIGLGESISAPDATGKPVEVSFGVECDDLAALG